MPNHYVGDLLSAIEMSGLSRVRTELVQLAVVPALAPHPVQRHRQFSRHRDLRDLPSAAHGQVQESTAPLRLTSYRNLRRLHQQKSQQRIALLADVTQSAPLAARLLRRYQSHIAGHLLATVETFRSSDRLPGCPSSSRSGHLGEHKSAVRAGPMWCRSEDRRARGSRCLDDACPI